MFKGGNGRQEIFHKEKDYEALINLMKEAMELKKLCQSVNRQRKHPTAIGIMNEGKILVDDLKVFDPD